MNEQITYEVAEKKDAETLASFRYAMFRDMRPNEDLSALESELVAASLDYYRQAIGSPDEYTCIARIDGCAIGSGSVMFQERPPHVLRIRNLSAYILTVYVKQEHRGKGVATRIMGILMEEAKRRGAFRIGLHASPFGRPIYERIGFAPKDTYMEMEL